MRSHSDGAKKLQKEVKELTEQLRRITATEKQVDKETTQSTDHKTRDCKYTTVNPRTASSDANVTKITADNDMILNGKRYSHGRVNHV